jgi:tetratricopeptide (TPR) repeat protein
MGIAHWFRRRRSSSHPHELLTALIEGFERKDYTALMPLINDNADTIRSEFKSWMTVPESVRQDPEAVQRYAHTLLWLASIFEKSGDSSLKECFESGGRQLEDVLERATQLTDGGQAAEAVALLRANLDELRSATGTGVERFRALLLGRLGIALDKLGDTREAIQVTREALELCRQSGDEEGVRAYSANLKVLGGYDVSLSDASHPQRFRVVFMDGEGQPLSAEELPGPTGHVRWEIQEVGQVNPEAKRLHVEGRAAGQRGEIDAAIALFTQAAVLDPAWPYPIYDRAFSHLLKKDAAAALADYRKTLELAPTGFFVAATAADLLTREAAGEFPSGLYATFAMLEHMSREERGSIAAQLVQQFPTHAPAWQLHAQSIKDPAARLEAIERGLAARPDPETRGSLLVMKALVLNGMGERERAMEILEPMATSIDQPLGVQPQALVALAIVRSGKRPSAG